VKLELQVHCKESTVIFSWTAKVDLCRVVYFHLISGDKAVKMHNLCEPTGSNEGKVTD